MYVCMYVCLYLYFSVCVFACISVSVPVRYTQPHKYPDAHAPNVHTHTSFTHSRMHRPHTHTYTSRAHTRSLQVPYNDIYHMYPCLYTMLIYVLQSRILYIPTGMVGCWRWQHTRVPSCRPRSHRGSLPAPPPSCGYHRERELGLGLGLGLELRALWISP